ncbi:MAG: crotonase/enoyl-CoA hydratase family protein [Burkholderiaceae bacterium]
MQTTCFELTIENQIAHIVMSRPDKRNAMIREFWEELPQLIKQIDSQSLARVIVISSTGPHFTSGIDVNMFAQHGAAADGPDKQREKRIQHGADFYSRVKEMQQTFSTLEDCRVPVLAAIQGGCIGGGVDLITACCMRYMTEDAFLTIYETNIGMTADVGTFPRLAKLIPEGIVRELAYTGRRMPAAEARSVGLINGVFPDQASMLEAVMKTATEIASKAPMAVYGCKKMITHARDNTTASTLDYVGIWNASFLSIEEIGEAMQAKQEKRAPQFANLPAMAGVIGNKNES